MITSIFKPQLMYMLLAAEYLKSGKVVAFPTETVYGLGADAFNPDAVKKIFEAKGRPADNPLIVHINTLDMLDSVAQKVPDNAYKLAEKFWPGPLTVVVPKSEKIPYITTGGLDTVGVRMPLHPVARRLIELCGLPLAAPSANLSGSPSPTSARRVYEDMKGRIEIIIDGGECEVGVESTVVSFEGDAVRILRPGAVTKEMLLDVVSDVIVDDGVFSGAAPDAKVKSPGMKYKHYAPKADVIIVNGGLEEYRKYVEKNAGAGDFCLLFDESEKVENVPFVTYGLTSQNQAHELFEALRTLDEKGAKTVFARCPQREGLGLAVYNRILRAAGFKIVEAKDYEQL